MFLSGSMVGLKHKNTDRLEETVNSVDIKEALLTDGPEVAHLQGKQAHLKHGQMPYGCRSARLTLSALIA